MVTLDIEDNQIKMMVVKGQKIDVAASLELEPGLVEDGVIINKEIVSQRIKALFDSHQVTERSVICSISGMHSIYRMFRIPRLPGALLEEAVQREMERVLPVSLDEIYVSWQAVTTADEYNVICLVGVPRNAVDSMMETLDMAHLETRLLDVRPLAAARLSNEKDALILNIEQNSFDIVIMLDGIPEVLRTLAFPDAAMSEGDTINTIIDEVERTIKFYNSSHRGNPVNTDIATFIGGEFGEQLNQRLGYNVRPFPVMLSYPQGFDASEYMVNIGLALKQIKTSESKLVLNVNVISKEYLPKPIPRVQLISMIVIIVSVIILVPTIIIAANAFKDTMSLQGKVNSVRALVQVRQGTEEQVIELHEVIKKRSAERDVFTIPLDSYQAQREGVSGDLNIVTSLLPGTVILDLAEYEEKSTDKGIEKLLTVSGTATDEEVIIDYSRALRESDHFSQVTVLEIEVIDFNKVNFVFELKS